MTIDYFSNEDLRKILDSFVRGEGAKDGKPHDRDSLGVLTSATPLVAVASGHVVDGARTFDTPYTPMPAREEEVFTKHDTLNEPETPVGVLDQEIEEEQEDLYSLKNFSL